MTRKLASTSYAEKEKYSRFWERPQVINAYCEEKAGMVLEYLGAIFEDLISSFEGAVQLAPDVVLPMSSVEGHRLAIDKFSSLLRLKGLQLDVLRRAMDHKQEEIQALEDDRCAHLKHANERLASTETGRPLPSLPNEVIGNICNSLYLLERDETHSTVKRLADDTGTTSALRRLILRDVPVVVANGEVDLRDRYMKSEIANFVGSDPVVLLPHQLDKNTPFPGSSITVLINLVGWPSLKNEMPMLCQYPWRNLILSGNGYDARDERMAIMNTLVRDYGHKLASLDHLIVDPFDDTVFLESQLPSWNPLDVSEIQDFPAKLRSARLHWRLLPGLHRVLSAITDLEVSIPADETALRMSLNAILEPLEHHSNTVITLTLVDRARDFRWRLWSRREHENDFPTPFPTINEQGYRISFPRLKRLSLRVFTDCIAMDVLQTLDCPSLSEIAIRVGSYVPNGDLGNSRISAAFLHQMHPSVECISFGCDYSKRQSTVQFLKDLASPDLNGKWLLPKLDTMKFGLATLSLLKVFTQVVTNRLRSNQTNSIRSVTAQCSSETAGDSYVNSLQILVPHYNISVSEG